MKIKASVLQDHHASHLTLPDETSAPAALLCQCEAFKESYLAPQMALAHQAVKAGTSLLVFSEDCNGAGSLAAHRLDRPDLFEMLAEPVPGPTSERMSEVARSGSCYVVSCFFEKSNGRIYNTALLLDPSGKPVGKYHKTHLPPVEQLMTTPGKELPVFETDIGCIGMLICYDMMTPEAARCLALKGADVLCWPSAGYGWWDEAGDFTIQSRAHDNQVYLLGALPTHSCIVNPYGDILASGGLSETALLTAEIEPGADPLQDPLHTNTYLTQTPSLRERHLFDRRPDLYSVITNPIPPLVARYPETHMHDLERDRQAAFRRYRERWGELHWQTRKDRRTH